MIRDEDGMLTGYVYVDLAGRDPGSYIEEAERLLRDKVKLPPGYAVAWSGQYEAMQRVKERLTVVIPADAAPDLPAALHEHPVGDEDLHHRCWRCRSRPSARSGSCTCSATT